MCTDSSPVLLHRPLLRVRGGIALHTCCAPTGPAILWSGMSNPSIQQFGAGSSSKAGTGQVESASRSPDLGSPARTVFFSIRCKFAAVKETALFDQLDPRWQQRNGWGSSYLHIPTHQYRAQRTACLPFSPSLSDGHLDLSRVSRPLTISSRASEFVADPDSTYCAGPSDAAGGGTATATRLR